ncbi:MAG: hypothetical protein WDN04_23605 [Rhodospirillales bacterium]
MNSGTGEATIYLNDTTTGSTINQFVWLDDGHSVVYANGANDAVIATIGGQTINGGSSADSNLTVVLAASAGNDLVNGGAGASIVFDSSTNDTVNAGTAGFGSSPGPILLPRSMAAAGSFWCSVRPATASRSATKRA